MDTYGYHLLELVRTTIQDAEEAEILHDIDEPERAGLRRELESILRQAIETWLTKRGES